MKDLLRGTSDSLRLLALTNHMKLRRRDLVWIPWLAVNCKHLCNYALEMAPDHTYGEGAAAWYFGLAPTSGPDQSP